LTDVYNAIKAQEANFPIPKTAATYVVGTLDALTGRFTYAVPTYSETETDPGPLEPGGPLKPAPHPITLVGGRITALNVENVTLQFNVKNRQGKDFVLSVPGFPDVHAAPSQDSVTLNVGSASGIEQFTLTCGRKYMNQLPLEIIYRIVGAGAFTMPALPVTIIYAPPADQSHKNTASWSFSNTTGTSSTLIRTRQQDSKTPDSQFSALADFSSAIQFASQVMQGSSDPGEKAIAIALGQVSKIFDLIPKVFGQTTVTSTVGTTSTQQKVLTLTITEQQTVTTSSQSGGPGSGDLIFYLTNARLCWFANDGLLQLALLGWDRVASVSAGFLQNQGTQSGLDPATIQALLALDPFVAGGPQAALAQPRFKLVETAEINAGEWKRTETYSFNQQDTSTSIESHSTIIDMKAGWLSFLGFGPERTGVDTVTWNFNTSTQNTAGRTVTDTVDLFAGPTEIYSVEVYADVVFGTFAYRSVPIAATAKLTGTIHDSLNKPLPFAEVTLVNNGRRFVTRADAHGRYAFHSGSIAPGHTVISAGHTQTQVAFAGKPVGSLNLKTAAKRTA
jgi:hypothetical protein